MKVIKNKRNVFVCLYWLLLCILLIGCSEIKEEQMVERQERSVSLNEELFMSIQYEDSYDELKNKIGDPSKYEGNIKKYGIYELEDGNCASILTFDGKVQLVNISNSEGEKIYSLKTPTGSDEKDGEDQTTIFDSVIYYNKSECKLKIDDFDEIVREYNFYDLILTIGKPTALIGSGMIQYVYVLEDDTFVLLTPNPNQGTIMRIAHYSKNGELLGEKNFD